MSKLIVVAACVVAGVAGVGAGVASAGKPVVPGCIGESVSANAHAMRPYGGFIREVTPRNDFGTLGDAVQAVRAGDVPDDLYPNTCN